MTAPDDLAAIAHERDWILKHGVSNLRSLTTALTRQSGLKFAGVNPDAKRAAAGAGSWLLAWVRPADLPSDMPRSWWVGVVESGTGMIAYRPVPMPARSVVPALLMSGVTETRFAVEPAEPAAENPFVRLPGRRGRDSDDSRSVYFIRADGPGLIKIGVAGSVQHRLSTLQTASPVPLTLIAVIPGVGQPVESELHERFAEDRVRGEWFEPSAKLLSYIAAHATPAGAAR